MKTEEYNIYFYIICLVFLSINGCIVAPQITSIPLISEKNEMQINGGICTIEPGYAVSIAYAPTNRIALQIYGYHDLYFKYFTHPFYYQGAVGYFYKNSINICFEVYGGYGYGYGYANPLGSTEDKPSYGGLYDQYFIQFNLGKKNKHFDVGGGIKTGMMDYTFYSNYSPNIGWELFKDNSFFLQPTFNIRVGGEKLKFEANISGLLINFPSSYEIPYGYINIGLGMNYRFKL